MLSISRTTRVFLATEPTDMRKGFDGLFAIVENMISEDPFSGHLFVFRNQRRDRLKVLWWDRDGLAVFYKRLERGSYQFPTDADSRNANRSKSTGNSQRCEIRAEELTQLVAELELGKEDSVSTDDGSDDSTAQESDDSSKKKKRKGHGRRPIPAHIEREIIVHELSDEERICPCCGGLRNEISRETSEQMEFVPGYLKALHHERIVYACGACEENVVTAPKPPQPIEKGLPGPGLLAHTVLSKYGDYLPSTNSV